VAWCHLLSALILLSLAFCLGTGRSEGCLPLEPMQCDPGWEGEYCEECVRMPGCLHGTCHQPWQCICHTGWAGKFCDKDIHICEHQSPCQNGAQCIYDRDGEYSCLCPEGFHGKDCEMKTGPYDNGFASNFTCRCLAGFVGALCEHDVDDCLMRPCANGATCHDGVNRFSCQCQVGFEGRFCTININDCASQPCKNGAKCYDRINDYDCLCPDRFTGKTCEISVPESRSSFPLPFTLRQAAGPNLKSVIAAFLNTTKAKLPTVDV
uniref:Protein delta homolog 2 n=1 Tax=Zosterops lateralis melanops TaxID=1220523 RepID=A0A8D2P8I8_ZOSLA